VQEGTGLEAWLAASELQFPAKWLGFKDLNTYVNPRGQSGDCHDLDVVFGAPWPVDVLWFPQLKSHGRGVIRIKL